MFLIVNALILNRGLNATTQKRSKMRDTGNRIVRAFLNYRDVLTAALLKLSVKPFDVDDILQESLARALEADEVERIKYPQSYLFMVSRNMVFREQQRRAREVQCQIDDAVFESSAAAADEEAHHKQMLQVFWEAIDSLPKAHQRAILLRRIYGLTQKEVAKKMGVSQSSVEKYFAQGIRRCQDIMAARGFQLTQTNRNTLKKRTGTMVLDASHGEGRVLNDK